MSTHWSEPEQCVVYHSGAHRVVSRGLVKAMQARQRRWGWITRLIKKLKAYKQEREVLKLAPEATALCIDCCHGVHGIPGLDLRCSCACHKG